MTADRMTTLPTGLEFHLAEQAFAERDHHTAVERLETVLATEPGNRQARELLMRSLYHRASLPRAEAEARTLLAEDPTDEYARLVLVRTLERQSRHDEAASHRRVLAAITGNDEHLEGHRAFR